MSAVAATQFNFDTVIHFLSAAQVDQAESLTIFHTVEKTEVREIKPDYFKSCF